jgi:aminoglycoside phosphotransferase (APT) family kinase protein
MHPVEIHVDLALAKALIEAHCPDWRLLPISKVSNTSGTDHHMFRLGADKALRLPRRPSAALQVEKEQTFLPTLAKCLTIATPFPVKAFGPSSLFPYPWSVCKWLEGETLSASTGLDQADLTREIAITLLEIWAVDMSSLSSPGDHNFHRGVPLSERDAQTHAAIAQIGDEFDASRFLKIWDKCLAAKPHQGPPVVIHGDLSPTNLLARDGRLVGVLDWGGLALGDPATDLMIAWSYLKEPFRFHLRFPVSADDAMWTRGIGWALSVAAIQIPYYQGCNDVIASSARHTLQNIVAGDAYL